MLYRNIKILSKKYYKKDKIINYIEIIINAINHILDPDKNRRKFIIRKNIEIINNPKDIEIDKIIIA